MGVIGGALGYRLLRVLWPSHINHLAGRAYADKDKLKVVLGPDVYRELEGKVVVDFGCGEGLEAVRIAQNGAARVIGVDIQDNFLASARANAAKAGVSRKCEFVRTTTEKCDVVVAVDSFEHFENPKMILSIMRGLLKPDGYIWTSFGPTWRHPYGGHVFSPFPWAHLVFTESALVKRRAEIKRDNVTRFNEIPDGLGQLTIRKFLKTVDAANFDMLEFEPVPIRKVKFFANRLTREFTTSIVRCKLRPRVESMSMAA